jgi:hypothetical protein
MTPHSGIQRLRRSAGFTPTDSVDYFYSFVNDLNGQLESMLTGQREFLQKNLKRPVEPLAKKPADVAVTKEEQQDINGSTFVLTLVRKE